MLAFLPQHLYLFLETSFIVFKHHIILLKGTIVVMQTSSGSSFKPLRSVSSAFDVRHQSLSPLSLEAQGQSRPRLIGGLSPASTCPWFAMATQPEVTKLKQCSRGQAGNVSERSRPGVSKNHPQMPWWFEARGGASNRNSLGRGGLGNTWPF